MLSFTRFPVIDDLYMKILSRATRTAERFLVDDSRPEVYDVKQTYAPLLTLERNVNTIKEEFQKALETGIELPKYTTVDPDVTPFATTTPGRWDILPIIYLEEEYFVDLFEETHALLKGIPDVVYAAFSRLEPKKSIGPHKGAWRGVLRYHLGLFVPRVDPPRLRVGSSYLEWQEGKGFMFDDTYEHEVTNEAQEERIVLMVDVLRPLDRVRDFTNRLLIRQFGSILGDDVQATMRRIEREAKELRRTD